MTKAGPSDAQLGVALYRVIADPELTDQVDGGMLRFTFTEVEPIKLADLLGELVQYGFVEFTGQTWRPMPYLPRTEQAEPWRVGDGNPDPENPTG